MREDGLVGVEGLGALRGGQAQRGLERVERGREVGGTGHVGAEAGMPVRVALHDGRVGFDKRRNGGAEVIFGDEVLLQERRARRRRVQHERLLVRSVQRAGEERVHDLNSGLGIGVGRAEQADLALQHQVQRLDVDRAVGKPQHAVRVHQAVAAAGARDHGIEVGLGRCQQAAQLGDLQRLRRRRGLAVHRIAIRLEGPPEPVQQPATNPAVGSPAVGSPAVGSPAAGSPAIGSTGFGSTAGRQPADIAVVASSAACHDASQRIAMAVEGSAQFAQPFGHGRADRHAGRRRALQQAVHEREVVAQVEHRHHRDAEARERVVGVVPLGPLRVQPDAAQRHQVGQLRQGRNEQLLCQRCVMHLLVVGHHQLAVGADGLEAGLDLAVQAIVELDGVLGIAHDLVVGLDAVGRVGVREALVAQQACQQFGIVAVRYVEQPVQVDDLVVAPVAEVGPAARLGNLPVHPLARHAVRVVPVQRRCVQELRDHRRRIAGEAVRQHFPVLEDVAPVAFVGRARGLGPGADEEAIPGPARIAMAAAERERQVLADQPGKIGVGLGASSGTGAGVGAGVSADGPAQLAELDHRLKLTCAAFESGSCVAVA